MRSESASFRILVVDDYKDYRRKVRLLLQARPDWQVTCEVSDGLEAVQKAEELQPDVILLDIGLPKLNGVEAARRIRQLAPNSKIVFLSMETSLDVVQAALSTGARGYVHKTRALHDLLPAIDAVLRGKRFASSSLIFEEGANKNNSSMDDMQQAGAETATIPDDQTAAQA